MKYYAIRTHYIPTEKNDRKDAVEHYSYSGKSGFNLDTKTHLEDMATNQLWDCQYALDHCYQRFCDAKRSLNKVLEYNQSETSYGFWNVTSDIIVIEK